MRVSPAQTPGKAVVPVTPPHLWSTHTITHMPSAGNPSGRVGPIRHETSTEYWAAGRGFRISIPWESGNLHAGPRARSMLRPKQSASHTVSGQSLPLPFMPLPLPFIIIPLPFMLIPLPLLLSRCRLTIETLTPAEIPTSIATSALGLGPTSIGSIARDRHIALAPVAVSTLFLPYTHSGTVLGIFFHIFIVLVRNHYLC